MDVGHFVGTSVSFGAFGGAIIRFMRFRVLLNEKVAQNPCVEEETFQHEVAFSVVALR